MSFSGTKGYITKPKPGVKINPQHPLSRGLVGYWLFNEGSGSRAYDISGNGNHGTLTNISPNAQGSGWSGSKYGGGLAFGEVDVYVDCGNDKSLNITDAITIEAWVKPVGSHLGGYGGVWWNGRATLRDRILVANNGSLLAQYSVGTATAIAGTVPLNIWTHVVFTYDGSEIVFWVNEIKQTPTVASGPLLIGSNARWIGQGHSTTYPFNGSIDSVRIYNRALSAAEIKTLYQDPFCNLLRVPIRRYSVIAPAIMNQFQIANIGADLYNGAIIA